MKNFIILFALIFSTTLFCNNINAQSGYVIEDLHLGEIRLGDTFTIPLNNGYVTGGYAATFQQVSPNTFIFVGDWISYTPGMEQLIGAIATNHPTQKQIVYYIYAILVK